MFIHTIEVTSINVELFLSTKGQLDSDYLTNVVNDLAIALNMKVKKAQGRFVLERTYPHHYLLHDYDKQFRFFAGIFDSVFEAWTSSDVMIDAVQLDMIIVNNPPLRGEAEFEKVLIPDPSDINLSVSFRAEKGIQVLNYPILYLHGPRYSWIKNDSWDLIESIVMPNPGLHLPKEKFSYESLM